MSQILINTSMPNDGLGDALRDAFNSTNTNFTELFNNKVDKVGGKGLSSNDYTTTEKTKLDGIETAAEVNVQSDWNQNDDTQDDYIKNKPGTIGFLFIEDCLVRKADGNTSTTVIEANDEVHFKKISNSGDPLLLIGHSYIAGDKQQRASYTQNNAVDI